VKAGGPSQQRQQSTKLCEAEIRSLLLLLLLLLLPRVSSEQWMKMCLGR
jgi:hypothetical protein